MGDDEVVVRNRVSSMVTSEVKAGRLVPTKGGFALGDVRFWASMKWPGRFADVPAHAGIGHGAIDLPGFSVSGSGQALPTTLADAHQEILDLHRRVEALQRELEFERERVRDFEPDATRWRDWNRKKGRPRSR